MSTLQEQLEIHGLFADRVNEIVKQYAELNSSIYEFLNRRSSSKYDSLRGKEAVYKLFVEMNEHESISEQHFDYAVNRLMGLSEVPITMRTEAKRIKKWGGKSIGRGHAQSLMAGLFGYGSYRDAMAASVVNNKQIKNLRYGQPARIAVQGLVEMRPSVLKAVAGKQPARPYEGTPLVMSKKDGMRMGGVLAKDMAWFVRDYGTQFRTPWLEGMRSELRHIAVKRFYGLPDANALAPYLKLRIFPPHFEPKNFTTGETQLATHFAATSRRETKWTAMTAFLELRPWCATPEIAKELEDTLGALSKGKANRFAQIIRRKYGVVMVVLDHSSGIGLITEKGKITKITRLVIKPGKVPKRERVEYEEPEDRQPEFHEPPRIVLTSHEPAYQGAFRELHKRTR